MRRGATISSSSSSSTLRERQNTASGKRSNSSSSLGSGPSVLSHLRWERPPAACPRATNIPGFKSAVGDTIHVRQRGPVDAMMMTAMMIAALSKVGGAAVDGGGNAIRGVAFAVMPAADGERAAEPVTRAVIVLAAHGMAAALSKVGRMVIDADGDVARGIASAVAHALRRTEMMTISGSDARPPPARARDAAGRSAPHTSPAAAGAADRTFHSRRAASNGDTMNPRFIGIGKTLVAGTPHIAM